MIETVKAPGPVAGTFAASGAFVDSGAINNLNIHFGGPYPTFLITFPTIQFTGTGGTFTIKAQIKEMPTTDPLVDTNTGTWVVVDGTGAYARLRGQGTVSGIKDDHVRLINRTYSGLVHFEADPLEFRTVP